MRHEYAGISVDLGYWVEILDVHVAVPIFHRQHDMKQEEDHWYTVTACGRKLYEEETVNGRVWTTNHTRASLPARHAVRFSRPCATCWPELRNQPSLFRQPQREKVEAEPLPV